MKKSFLAILAIAFALNINAQTRLIQNVSGRKTFSLNGEWKSIVDPYGHGLGCRFGNDQTFDGKSLQDYDFDTSPTLKVPGDWNTQRKELFYYEGLMWYRTKFDYTLEKGKRAFIHFGAANYIAQVWFNGKFLGRHEGGFTPFEYEITNLLKDKDNSLVVCVDDTRKPDGIPTMNTDWWNYGGITREVCVIETAQTFINDYKLSYTDNKGKNISGYVQLNDSSANQKVLIEIPELNIKKNLTSNAFGKVEFTFKSSPKLWSPDSPKLYEVKLTYGNETIRDRIGFRTIKTQGNKILLNGKPIFLCGVNMHDESTGSDDESEPCHRCITREEDSTLLAMAKEMGCNFVRLAHYPHNEEMVRLADEMGLMVWSEIPLYWGIDWKNKQTYKLAEQQLEEMIARDHNRASVIIWSIANETAVRKERTEFLSNLANKARSLDDSRLISAALQNVNKRLTPTTYTVEDPLKDALDIFSYNEYIGWYDAPKEFCDSIIWQLDTGKPVVISEFGGGAKHFDNPNLNPNDNNVVKVLKNNAKAFFNEDNQVELYKHQFTMLRKIPGLAGTIPWVLKDFRSPHRLLEGVQDGYNVKGLYSKDGKKKAAWQIVKDWNEEHKR